jgi:hypothetical protein
VGIPNSRWKGNSLQFKFCGLDGLYFAVGITKWYSFPIPVWTYKPSIGCIFDFGQYKVAYIYK